MKITRAMLIRFEKLCCDEEALQLLWEVFSRQEPVMAEFLRNYGPTSEGLPDATKILPVLAYHSALKVAETMEGHQHG